MACKCGSTLIVNIGAKCSDLCVVSFNKVDGTEAEREGYVPYIGIGGGDYIGFSYCATCGLIQNHVPMTETELMEALFNR